MWLSRSTGKQYRLLTEADGNTPRAPAPRAAIPCDDKSARTMPTVTATAIGFACKRCIWDRSSPTGSASMTCTAMRGNSAGDSAAITGAASSRKTWASEEAVLKTVVVSGPPQKFGEFNSTRAAYRDWIRPNSQGIVIVYPGNGLSGEGHGHDPQRAAALRSPAACNWYTTLVLRRARG